MSDLIQVAFCCNDHRNGNFTGRFDAINETAEPITGKQLLEAVTA